MAFLTAKRSLRAFRQDLSWVYIQVYNATIKHLDGMKKSLPVLTTKHWCGAR